MRMLHAAPAMLISSTALAGAGAPGERTLAPVVVESSLFNPIGTADSATEQSCSVEYPEGAFHHTVMTVVQLPCTLNVNSNDCFAVTSYTWWPNTHVLAS
jgi:hypothetical protein